MIPNFHKISTFDVDMNIFQTMNDFPMCERYSGQVLQSRGQGQGNLKRARDGTLVIFYI